MPALSDPVAAIRVYETEPSAIAPFPQQRDTSAHDEQRRPRLFNRTDWPAQRRQRVSCHSFFLRLGSVQ
jgi:hypothetical protein